MECKAIIRSVLSTTQETSEESLGHTYYTECAAIFCNSDLPFQKGIVLCLVSPPLMASPNELPGYIDNDLEMLGSCNCTARVRSL